MFSDQIMELRSDRADQDLMIHSPLLYVAFYIAVGQRVSKKMRSFDTGVSGH